MIAIFINVSYRVYIKLDRKSNDRPNVAIIDKSKNIPQNITAIIRKFNLNGEFIFTAKNGAIFESINDIMHDDLLFLDPISDVLKDAKDTNDFKYVQDSLERLKMEKPLYEMKNPFAPPDQHEFISEVTSY